MSDSTGGKTGGKPFWYKGMPSPNPGGRPKNRFPSRNLQEAIRKAVDPDVLTKAALSIACGEPLAYYVHPETGAPTPCPVSELPEDAKVIEYVKPSTAERQRAMEFLADRAGWRPPAALDVTVSQGPTGPRLDYAKLSDEQLDQLIKLMELAQAGEEPEKQLALPEPESE